MYKIISCLFCSLVISFQLKAQIWPKENSKLNYRLIGFSFPPLDKEISLGKKTINYKIEIATGNYYYVDSFKKNITLQQNTINNKIVIEVPAFGSQYTWRVIYIAENLSETKSQLYHFSTLPYPATLADTHLRIIQKAEKYEDACIFIDGAKALFDMKGNPLWFLPKLEMADDENFEPRDIKLTPQGTISLLINFSAYEISYNGQILWKPGNNNQAGVSSEWYHHEFTRLANGHYMVLSRENVPTLLTALLNDSNTLNTSNTNTHQENKNNKKDKSMSFGTIIEYDENSKVVWSWKSYDYFKKLDSVSFCTPTHFIDVHENSFFFDERDNTIYTGFKGISQIIKLKYPQGNILNVYGNMYKLDDPKNGNFLFCGQHSVNKSSEGYIYVFDNNLCDSIGLPKIIMFREPTDNLGTLEKIWEYQCTVNDIGTATQNSYTFQTGGNAIELPDRSFFASMSNPECTKIFIVNRNKKTLWSAVYEQWDPIEKNWKAVISYRASIITSHKDLEQLIWNSEK